MMHPYVYWLLAMEQQHQLAHRAARSEPDLVRRSTTSFVRRALTRRHARRQLGHAMTARRATLGCVA